MPISYRNPRSAKNMGAWSDVFGTAMDIYKQESAVSIANAQALQAAAAAKIAEAQARAANASKSGFSPMMLIPAGVGVLLLIMNRKKGR